MELEFFFNKNINMEESFIQKFDKVFLCTYDNNNNNLKKLTLKKINIIIN